MEDEVIPGVPANLKELVNTKHQGFILRLGYVLELEHKLWGYFPAVNKKTGRQLVATDPQLLQNVWKMLTPRKSKMTPVLLYVSDELNVAYPIRDSSDYEQEQSKPFRLFTRQEFETLIAESKAPFGWEPGLIGAGMTREEFLETIEAARAEAS